MTGRNKDIVEKYKIALVLDQLRRGQKCPYGVSGGERCEEIISNSRVSQATSPHIYLVALS